MVVDPFVALAPRLASGRPLLLGGDVRAALQGQGIQLSGPGALGKLARERPDDVQRHYLAEIDAGIDVLPALTSETTPRALAQVGMAHRSAAITSNLVDQALRAAEQAGRPVVVAGELGTGSLAPLDVPTLVEEHGVHASRLAAAGVGLILARGMASRTELMAALVAAANTGLPTWAIVELDPDGEALGGEPTEQLVSLLESAGASAVLFEAPSIRAAWRALSSYRERPLPLGLILDASPSWLELSAPLDPQFWAEMLGELLPLDARIFGGGHGCSSAHTSAMGRWLQQIPARLHPSSRPTAGNLALRRGGVLTPNPSPEIPERGAEGGSRGTAGDLGELRGISGNCGGTGGRTLAAGDLLRLSGPMGSPQNPRARAREKARRRRKEARLKAKNAALEAASTTVQPKG